jgi:hypothetical protein
MRHTKILIDTFLLSLALTVILFITPAMASSKFYITGVVLSGAPPKPIPSVMVETYINGTLKGRSLTGDDGKYYIDGLDEGIYDILVKKGQQELSRKQLRLTHSETFDITL